MTEGGCACVGYTIRTDYGTGVEYDVDRSSCPVHGYVTAYDPTTGIAVTHACFPNCRFPCVGWCPVDGHRTGYLLGEPDLAIPPGESA